MKPRRKIYRGIDEKKSINTVNGLILIQLHPRENAVIASITGMNAKLNRTEIMNPSLIPVAIFDSVAMFQNCLAAA
jgi:hypothetical protein